MFSFLITLLSDITQTGMLICSSYTKLSSVLNLNPKELSPKTNSSSSNSSIKENTSSLNCLIILK